MDVLTQLSGVTRRYGGGAWPAPGRVSLMVAPRGVRIGRAARPTPAVARDDLPKAEEEGKSDTVSMLQLRQVPKVYGQGDRVVLIRDGRVADQAMPERGPASPGQGW
jgi:hypothetical protein